MHLGRALHYIQDVSVPHHTISILTIAHANYEAFCAENVDNYLKDVTTVKDSYYKYADIYKPSDLVPIVANRSNRYYDKVKNSLDKEYWGYTADILMNDSVSMTATVVYMFALSCNLKLTDVSL